MDTALVRRRELRGRATDAERLLWRVLRMRQFVGLKFRRQHSVGHYIVDFYCADRQLAVELDGGQHFTVEGLAYDRRRTAYLAARGIRVLRFTNSELFENTEGVMGMLLRGVGR
jgi:type I restriction enzyme M protein